MTAEHRELETLLAAECRQQGLWCWINGGSAIRQHGSGMADSLIIGQHAAMFVELKSEDGRLTKAQLAFGRSVQRLGFEWRCYRRQQFDDGTVRADLEAL